MTTAFQPKCQFVGTQLRCGQIQENKCAPGSFRIKKIREGTVNLLFCCLKSGWQPSAQRCETGMKLASKHYNSTYFSKSSKSCVGRCYSKKGTVTGKDAISRAKAIAQRCGKKCKVERF